jgi:hypothetical protein
MAHGVDSTKTPGRPSHEAVEKGAEEVTQAGKSEEHKIDRAAMQGAKRAENRIKSNEDNTPGNSIFTK